MNRIISSPVAWLIAAIMLVAPIQAAATAPGDSQSAEQRQLALSAGEVDLELVEYVGGFEDPVYVTNAGDGSDRLFVAELRGVVSVVVDGQALDEPFLDISEIVRDEDGEQGFFAVAFHPDYSTNGYFYAVYTKEPDGTNVLARFQVSADDPNRADPASLTEILTIKDTIANHNGGDIAFGPDGYLFYGTGDEGGKGDPNERSQDGQSLFGKMLRLDVDSAEPYAIPPDNPFVDDPRIRDEIWSLGLRNPFRYTFDSQTGDLYIADVGQDAWEEIDVEPAASPGGLNYGWPIMEGFDCYPEDVLDCDTEGLTLPALVYPHESDAGAVLGCSITGGRVYRGAEAPFMDGAYIFGDWCTGIIWAGYRDDQGAWQQMELLDTFVNWTSFGEDESGELYGTDQIGGRVFRLVFSPALPVITEISPAGVIAGGTDFAIDLSGSGFSQLSEVLLDGQDLATTFVDSGRLTAAVPAGFVLNPGDRTISVRNGPDGEVSNQVTLLVTGSTFADPAFQEVWNRTDWLVAERGLPRTWIWGPGPDLPARYEPYAESPDGKRMVLYFDKSRMEITYPSSDGFFVWYVTNGLLVVEMMDGQIQVGDAEFVPAQPAGINVAGDPDDPQGITYATLAGLRSADPYDDGQTITAVLQSDGTVVPDGVLASDSGITAGPLSPETGHRTASVFWEFMTSQSPILVDGEVVVGDLFENPYFATGLPITEAYWTTVRVAGNDQQVMLQCFERRCLTYTPGNPAGWQVEAGNVGLHYYGWRYGEPGE